MTNALKMAIDGARDSASQLPAGDKTRHTLALLIGIVRRLADQPQIEQPIAPEPPEEATTQPPATQPPATTKPASGKP